MLHASQLVCGDGSDANINGLGVNGHRLLSSVS
jgi:hypothetical protein